MPETCNVHEEEVGIVRELAVDVKWLRRIGGWWFVGVGSFLVALMPLIITLFVWLASLERRISLIEQLLKEASR